MNATVARWLRDPGFQALPAAAQQAAMERFFDERLINDEFRRMPAEQQDGVRAAFVREHMAPAQLGQPAPGRGVLDETVSSLASGLGAVLEGVSGTAEMILPEGMGKETAGEFRQAVGRARQGDYLRRPEYLAEETVLEHPERLADWRWWVRSLGENIPNMAAMFLPGLGAVKAGKVLGLGAQAIRWLGRLGAWSGAATIEAGYAYGQAKDEMTAEGRLSNDQIESIAAMEGAAVGVVNGILEVLPFDNLVLRSSGADRVLKRIVRQAVVEGTTETAQEAVNFFVEKLGHKPDQALKDNIGRLLESGVIGAVMGGGAGLVMGPEVSEAAPEDKQVSAADAAGRAAVGGQAPAVPMDDTGAAPETMDAEQGAQNENQRAAHKAKVRADAENMLNSVLSEIDQETEAAAGPPPPSPGGRRIAPVRTGPVSSQPEVAAAGPGGPVRPQAVVSQGARSLIGGRRVAPVRTTPPRSADPVVLAMADADIQGITPASQQPPPTPEGKDVPADYPDLKPGQLNEELSLRTAEPPGRKTPKKRPPELTGEKKNLPAFIATITGKTPSPSESRTITVSNIDVKDVRSLNWAVELEVSGHPKNKKLVHGDTDWIKDLTEGFIKPVDTADGGKRWVAGIRSEDGRAAVQTDPLESNDDAQAALHALEMGRGNFEVKGFKPSEKEASVAAAAIDRYMAPFISRAQAGQDNEAVANIRNLTNLKQKIESGDTQSDYVRDILALYPDLAAELGQAASIDIETLQTIRKPPAGLPGVEKLQAAIEHVESRSTAQTFQDLGWPHEPDAMYRRLHDGKIDTLAGVYRGLQTIDRSEKEKAAHQPDINDDEHLISVLRVWEPMPSRQELKQRIDAIEEIKERHPRRIKLYLDDDYRPQKQKNGAWIETTIDGELERLKAAMDASGPGVSIPDKQEKKEKSPAVSTIKGKKKTKREKSLAEYQTYIDHLSDADREQVADMIEDDPKSPGLLLTRIQKALAEAPAQEALTAEPEEPTMGITEEEVSHGEIRRPIERVPEGVHAGGLPGVGEGRGVEPVLRDQGRGGPKSERGIGERGDAGLYGRGDRDQGIVGPVEDYTIMPADRLGHGGPKQKFRDNVAAIKLLAELETRPVTPEDQSILVKYVGWGGLSQAFPRPDGSIARGWDAEVNALKALLPEDEYAAARRSTQDAHYTNEPIVRAIYTALDRIGFKAGKMLEPAVGTGNFIGLMPRAMRSRSRVTGVELDPTSAKIAGYLYPKQNIVHSGFQDLTIAPGSFDAAVGNPPFGEQKLYDPRHKELKGFSIHNYFFAKSLIGLRPNGVLAMVVSSHLMDKQGGTQRAWIAARAELMGAIRLPNNAFKGTAGTEVTTDILFLRRRGEDESAGGPAWQDLKRVQGRDSDYRVNEYFADHPEMMLGELVPNKLFPGEVIDGLYRGVPGLSADPDADFDQILGAAIERLPEGVYRAGQTVESVQRPDIIVSDAGFAQPYGYTLDDNGRAVRRLPDVNGEQVFEPVMFSGEPLAGRRLERFKGLLKIRDALRRLVRAEVADESKAQLALLRDRLNRAYDGFVKKYGLISTTANSSVLASDPTDLPLLRSLEADFDPGISKAVAKRTGETPREPSAQKAAIFRVRTREPYRPATSAKDAKEALAIVLREDGVVDMKRLAGLAGLSVEQAAADLEGIVFMDPATGLYETAEVYLSGNVKEKLAVARRSGALDNAKALEAVIPEDVPPDLISFHVGSTWIPPRVYEDFAAEVLQVPTGVSYLEDIGVWSIVPGRGTSPYDTNRMGAGDIYKRMLQSSDITVYDYAADGSRTLNMEETTMAKAKAEEIDRAFSEWVLADLDRSDMVARQFNDKVNTTVEAKYDGSHMIFPGMGIITPGKPRDDQLLSHQKNVVWRLIQKGKGLADHVVGSGKTFLSISAGLEMKRMGLVKKPMYVVPNHLVGQWSLDFQKLYPGANVLIVSKKDFAKSRRQEFLSRIATGDWDAVVIAHSSFGFIQMPYEYERRFYHDQVQQYERAIQELIASEGKKSRSVKQMEKAKDRLKEKMKRLADKPKDVVVDFSELGVDALFVDEAHEFKNLFYATKRTRVAGLGNPAGSKKAFDMFVKTQYILEMNNGKGVFFLTGTPVSNSIAEMYTMMRYLEYDRMKQMGIRHFDQWSNMFASAVTDWEVDPTGTRYRLQTKMDFVNLPGLMAFYKDFADVVSTEDLQRWAKERGQVWPIPDIKGGKPINVVVKRSDLQKSFMDWIVHRFDHMPADPREDNPLKATGEAMKAALDIRLIDPNLPDHPGSKVNTAVDRIMDVYDRWSDRKGTQLVFCDLSVPKKSRGKHAKDIRDLKAKIRLAESRLDTAAGDAALEAEAEYTRLTDLLAKYSPAELMAAEAAFSVYDDIKAKLMARGVPEAEIAFIHDANTEMQKDDLFSRVRTGRVRILIGSTSKMGAGTNVQDRLVAEHNLDAPWRPSDLEQREGRIVRQGNKFYKESLQSGDTFEVEIYRYATKETLDTRRWQIIERKARSIEALRAGDHQWGDKLADTVGEAANAAEMKAAASGNPLILKEIQLRKDIEKLEARQRGERARRMSYERTVRAAEAFERNYDDYVAEVKTDVDLLEANPRNDSPEGWQVALNGRVFKAEGLKTAEPGAKKKEIQDVQKHNNKALKQAKADFKAGVAEVLDPLFAKKPSGKPEEVVFTVRGMDFIAVRNDTWKAVEFRPQFSGEEAYNVVGLDGTYGFLIYIKDGYSVNGLLVRMHNMIGNVEFGAPDLLRRMAVWRERYQSDVKVARKELSKKQEVAGDIEALRREHADVLNQLHTTEAQSAADKDFSQWESSAARRVVEPQYSIEPGAGELSLEDVQAVFAGQDVGVSATDPGVFWVRLKGGQGLEIRRVDRIDPDQAAIDLAYGQMDDDGALIAGKYQSGRIEISRDIGDRWTLAHESVHFLEDAGLLTVGDVNALRRKIRRLTDTGQWKTRNRDDVGGAEDRAAFVADRLARRARLTGPVGRILQKVKDIIDALINLVRRTAAGVVRDIESGAVYDVPLIEQIRSKSLLDGLLLFSLVRRQELGPIVTQDLENDRTFANKLHEMADVARENVGAASAKLQVRVQEMAGKASRKRMTVGLGYHKKVKESLASRRLDQAMFFYRDLGGDLSKIAEFRQRAQQGIADGTIKGPRKVYVGQVIKALEVAEKLSPEQIDFIDEMADRFEAAFEIARDSKVIQSHVDNYVRRIYKRKKADGDTAVYSGWSTGGHGFRVYHGAAQQRSYVTALDAILDGHELAVTGLTSAYDNYMRELVTVMANKAFIQRGSNSTDVSGRRLFTTNTNKIKGYEDYKELKASGFSVWQLTGTISAVDERGMGGVLETNSWGRKVFITKPERVPRSWAVYKPGGLRPSRVFYDNPLYDAKAAARDWADGKGYDDIRERPPKEVADQFQKLKLYAPANIADMINKMTATDPLFSQTPGLKAVARLNAGVKSWVLMTSFFHHLAGARSWVFGVHHGWGRGHHMVVSKDGSKVLGEFRDLKKADEFAKGHEGAMVVERSKAAPWRSYKAGLDKVYDLHPLVSLGVKNGLTLGELQDWSESALRDEGGLTERLVKHFGWERAAGMVERFRFTRERWTNSLFKKYFAGLKAEAFVVEFAHELSRAQEKHAAGKGQAVNADKVAERVARLINADFGGLHLKRMGRNPTMQLFSRLLLLAPDWTESNFRTVSGMIPGLNEKINKLVGDVPPPPGMDDIYRRFWGRVIMRIAISTIVAQLLLNGKDETDEFLQEQMFSNRFNRFRWTEIDISRLYEMMGIDLEGQRKTFSLGGHFFDPLKLIDPWRLIKGKASPAMRALGAGLSGSDWAERPFTGVRELMTTGRTVKGSAYEKKEAGLNRLPATVINQVINMQPIQMGQLMRYFQGEEDGLTALARSVGAHVHTAWVPRAEDPVEDVPGYGDVFAEIRRLKTAGALRMGPPDRRVTIGGVPAKMTAAQYDAYLRGSSETAMRRLKSLLNSAGYQSWGDDSRAAKIKAIIKNARSRERKKVKRRMRKAA